MSGTTLGGRYRIEEKVGSGGMSTVYRAQDTVLEREVAVKIMHRDRARDESFLERFKQEARAVAQLSHAHIVGVIDAGEERGQPYIVFELIEGETLKQRIRRTGPLPITDAVAYAIEIAQALQIAHDSKLVHRDIKPQNVLLDRFGHAKVTDFGIARSLTDPGLTEVGKVIGTTEYISPEQALGHEVDGQSDIYSLGVVLFEMLVGKPPFQADNPVTVATKHVREELPNVQRLRPGVSSALAAVVERATNKEPTGRYRSTAAMVSELEEVLSYEISRAGHSSEEATAVLEELAGEQVTGRPRFKLRHPAVATSLRLLTISALLAAIAAAAFFFVVPAVDRNDGSSARLKSVPLKKSDVDDYDPPPGDLSEHGEIVGNVVDGVPNSSWNSEIYSDPTMGSKQGVGLVIDAKRPIAAKVLEVHSQRPGYSAQVLGANTLPTEVNGSWALLAQRTRCARVQTFKLDTVNRRFRYYLLWFTELPPDPPYQASISQIKLQEPA